MEEIFFWEDRPAYPCACFFRAAFRGNLDRSALEEAIQQTLLRYPLLCSKIQFDSTGRLQWLVPEEPRFVICWDQAAKGKELPKARRIDLSAQTGIRFYAASGDHQSALVIQFHRSCSDALGIVRFLNDVLAVYDDPCGTVHRASQEPSASAIGAQRRNRWSPCRIPGALWRGFLLAGRKPLPLIPDRFYDRESPLREDYPTALWQMLDPAETALLIRAASRQKVTLNDLLLRDLLLALADWRSGGITGRNGWVRIMVPALSEKARASPGSTLDPVSLLFLDVHTREIASPRLLLKVHREMMARKLACDGDLFQLTVALGRRLHGGLSKHVRANKCLYTLFFSNMGKVDISPPSMGGRFASEGLVLESAQETPIVRPHAPVNIVVVTVGGSLSLTMSFDSLVIQRAEAEDLFQGLLRNIRDSARAL